MVDPIDFDQLFFVVKDGVAEHAVKGLKDLLAS